MDAELTLGAIGGGKYIQYEEHESAPRPLHSSLEGPAFPKLGTPIVKTTNAPPSTPSQGNELEMVEFQNDVPQRVWYHSLRRGRLGRGQAVTSNMPPAYQQ